MRFSGAIAISVGVHAVLGVVLALYLHHAPSRVTLAELDLSSVDLSFAETVEETAPVMPATAAPSDSPPPRPQETPPPARPREEIRPDVPGDVVLPVPKPPVDPMVTPKPVEPLPDETPSEAVERPVEKPVERPPEKPAVQSAPPVTPAPRQARVDAPPRPKRAIRPEYPARARARGEEGNVTLLLSVTAAGSVSSVTVATSSGFADLDEAAVRAARAARFTPARLKDAPVASTARLTLSFRLR